MIDFDNPPIMAADYRGTIEVYTVDLGDFDSAGDWVPAIEWYWRCKSRNGQILASGEGYKRSAGALNAIERQYEWAPSAEMPGIDTGIDIRLYVVPWRVVIHGRDGNIDKIGALY